MAIPKKRKPLANGNDVRKAIEIANKGGKKAELPEAEPRQAKNKKTKKKIGRPPLAEGRTAKMGFYVQEKTKERFDLAFPQEQYKRRKRGEKIDKSLIFEEILKGWLDGEGY